jgi:DNA segregation ATPase FtsK/SpoIIIE, S-DNA-T family
MQRGSRLSHEIWAVVVFFFAVLLILSLVSYHPAHRPPYSAAGSIRELYGFVGYHLANFLRQGVGLSAFLLPVSLFYVSYQLLHEASELTPLRLAGYAFFVLFSLPMLLSVLIQPDEVWDSGGVIGGFSERAILMPLFGRAGSYVVALSLFLVGFVVVCRLSLADLMRSLMSRGLRSSSSKVEGQWVSRDAPEIDPGSTKAPQIEKRAKPVQERFDFMEKDLK